MKHLKIAGLLAAAAFLFVAIGPSAASATKLYKGASGLGAGTDLSLSLAAGTSTSFTTTTTTTLNTCTGSTMTVKLTSAGSHTQTTVGTVAKSDLTWSGCTEGNATAIEGGEIEVHHITGTINGTVTARGFAITTATPLGPCVYTAGEVVHLGTLTGSTSGNATLHVNAVLLNTGIEGLCTQTARWIGTYTITSPSPLHVTTL